MPAYSALTDLGLEMLGEIPPWMRDDPDIRAVVHCHAKETERQQEMAAAVRDDCIPLRAGSRGLAWWEQYFGMTIEPVGQTEEQRRTAILGRIKREPPLGSGLSWKAMLTSMIGEGWTYEEFPEDAKIRVEIPYPPGSEVFEIVSAQLPLLPSWPCHLELELGSAKGFVLDLSDLDSEPFEVP